MPRALNLLLLLLGAGPISAQEPARPVEELRAAAEKGDAAAQYDLALYLLHGRQPDKEPGPAARWLWTWMNRGDIQAGTVWQAYGRLRDPAGAVPWLRRAADQRHLPAYVELGALHLSGAGVARDDGAALGWFRRAAEAGSVEGAYLVGRMLVEGRGTNRNVSEAAKWYARAAANGHADAAYWLAEMHAAGVDVPKDEAEAKRLFARAAEQGHFAAKARIEQQAAAERIAASAKKVARLRAAAERGSAKAQLELGHVYSRGEEAEEDEAEAVRWYRRAAEQGLADAMVALADQQRQGAGIAKNEAEAAAWYRKAAEIGNPDAQRMLGLAYAQGAGVPRDDARAFEWLRRAAEQGSDRARADFGYLFHAGRGVASDLRRAAWLFRLLDRERSGSSAYFLGSEYESETPALGRVARDPVVASFWFRVSFDGGFQASANIVQERADRVRKELSEEQVAAVERLFAAWKAAMAEGPSGRWGWSEAVSDARALLGAGDYQAAERAARLALEHAERERAAQPLREAEGLEVLAELLSRQRRSGEAVPLLERAVEIRERHPEADPSKLADALTVLASAYPSVGEARAEGLLRRALAIRERLQGGRAPEVAAVLQKLGELYYFAGRPTDAIPPLTRALAIHGDASPAPDDSVWLFLLPTLANAHVSAGQEAEAERLYLETIERLEEASPDAPLAARESLASLYERQERYAEAEALLRRQLALQEARGSPLESTLLRLGDLARLQGRLDEAEALLRRGLSLAEASPGRSGPPIAAVLLGALGEVLIAKGEPRASLPILERAAAVTGSEDAYGFALARPRRALMKAYATVRDFTKLDAFVEGWLAVLVKRRGEEGSIRWLLRDLPALYFENADPATAEALSRRSVEMQSRLLGHSHRELAESLAAFGLTARAKGRLAAARDFFEQGCGSGSGEACVGLALMYSAGEGVVEDQARAVALYRQACDGGYAIGCNNLGVHYANGQGVEKDLARAKPLFDKACDGGAARGCSGLGDMFSHGLGVEKDENQALAFYRRACDGGDPPGCNGLAYALAERGERLDEALAAGRKAVAADPENGAFQDTLGWVLHKRGDDAEAERHLQEAVSRVDSAVQWDHLGDVLWRLGRKTEAVESWRKALAAATQDHEDPGAIRGKIARAAP
jgi:hypothetical protein